ncbi:MAG: S8 family serine peptidase [Gemmatimonadetes bacterium]|nr:S8 family serine peptidase [Gemmatimonadota bacterium]MDA1102354.1 S8 family serine peptidase [Gemmatimonadota bacterium]
MSAVTVAIIDSGANVPHPHLPALAGGIAINFQGQEVADYVDRLGHGTAAAAAIHEKAPQAELYAVKVFDEQLATTVSILVRAIDWASSRGIRIANLSLGTPNDFREPELAPAVARAVERGTIIVSAHEHDGRRWYPGSLDGVVGVVMDADQERETVTLVESGGRTVVRASGYPRPIPGVPPERNLNGISFAVANATGALARALVDHPEVKTAEAAFELLQETASD